MADSIVPIALPITFSKVCEVVNQDLVGTNGRHLMGTGGQFAIATGTFDPTYVGIKDRLSNFRGYTYTSNVEENLSTNITISEVGNSYNWVDQDNIKILNTTTFAYSDMDATLGTDYLIAETFNFNIPPAAIINGIEMKVMRKATTNGTIKDGFIHLRSLGTLKGENKAIVDSYTTTWSEITYGGPTDLWGTTWTYTEINASNFGCSFRPVQPGPASLQRVQAAYIKLKVYYTP